MLGNNRGRSFDVYEGGERVLSVRYLNEEEPVMCCICECPTFSKLCVPYYCGPVREGCSEGGYSHACERCYARWERWNDAGMGRLYKPAHGGYPAPAPKPEPVALLHVQAGMPLDTLFYQRAFALQPGRYRLFLAALPPGVGAVDAEGSRHQPPMPEDTP